MVFRDPIVLLLLPVLLTCIVFIRRRRSAGFLFPSDCIIKDLQSSVRSRTYGKLFYLRAVCVGLVILALARPQISTGSAGKREGIAIVLSIDCSSTMLAEDLKLGMRDLVKSSATSDGSKRISRLEAARVVAGDFIDKRPDDLIGLVAFASEAFIVCPLTFDHKWLHRSLDRIKVGLIKDGTAIGSGILSSLNSLKDIRAKSRVIVFLSDGVNNFGQISPIMAAKAARAMGIKIYTIGLVSDGLALYPEEDAYGRREYKEVLIEVNEDVLKKIADTTGAEYFRVTDMDSLWKSYDEINKLEKVEMEEKRYDQHHDVFTFFLISALVFILLDVLLRNSLLRKIP